MRAVQWRSPARRAVRLAAELLLAGGSRGASAPENMPFKHPGVAGPVWLGGCVLTHAQGGCALIPGQGTGEGCGLDPP